MRAEMIILILLMMAVTYIPRVLPSFIIGKIKLGARMEKFLKLIPYTAMAALVFPGIFTSVGDKAWYGIVGGAVAAALAYFKCPVVVSVIAAVITDLVLLNLF